MKIGWSLNEWIRFNNSNYLKLRYIPHFIKRIYRCFVVNQNGWISVVGANLTKSQKITGLFVPIVSFVSIIYSANNKITITKWGAPMRFTSWIFLVQRFGLNFGNSVKLSSVLKLFIISFFGLILYKVIYILGLLIFI